MASSQANINQYYLQVQAVTPLEEARVQSPSHEITESAGVNLLPIVIFVSLAILTLVFLVSHRIFKIYGYSRSLGMMVVVFAIAVGGLNIGNQIQISSLAGPNNTPRILSITQVDDTGFVIDWQTNAKSSAYIQVFEEANPKAIPFTFMSKVDESVRHRIEVYDLAPNTTYQVVIFSNGQPFGGSQLTVRTTANPSSK